MSQITFSANQNGSGIFTIQSPVSNTNRSITLPDLNGTVLLDSQIASQAEAQAGTINTKLMTPLRVDQQIGQANASPVKIALNASGSAPIYACRAWVNFNGTGTVGTNLSIRGSGNVSSVFKNAVGTYTITFTTAMPDINYSVLATKQNQTVNTDWGATDDMNQRLITSCRIVSIEAGSPADSFNVNVAIFR